MKLSMRIRIARQRARLSQEALATRLGVTRGAVANWECSMGAVPATSRLELLALATGVCFEWLATGRGPVAWSGEPEQAPAVEGELVYDPDERRLLAAYRLVPRQARKMLLGVVESQATGGLRRNA